MPIVFDKDKGFIVDDVESVREKVRTIWKNAFKGSLHELDTSPSTPQGQLIDAQTASIMNKDSEFLFLVNQFNPETAEGIFQDALANIYFLQRQPATSTTVACTCYGLRGTVIPAGSIVKSADGYQLVSIEDAIISDDGSITNIFILQNTGAIPIAANTVTNIVTQIAGWDKVNNTVAGVLGRNRESRSEFYARIKRSVAINSQGSREALESAISNLSGVTACRILDNDKDISDTISGVTIPAHSICISVFGGNDTDIAKQIILKKDTGCGTYGNTKISATDSRGLIRTYNILRPSLYPIGIKVVINQNDLLPIDIIDRVKKAIINNFAGVDGASPVKMDETLYATRFTYVVIGLGVSSVQSVEIKQNDTYYDVITFNVSQMPTLDINDIEVEIV